MLYRKKAFVLTVVVLVLLAAFAGCNRLTDDPRENQAPAVYFVNVPLDSSTFSFAPVVRWRGFDPDGLITEFQIHDDSTQAAVNAYEQDRDHPGTLQAYIDGLPASVWRSTQTASDTIYLRRKETDSLSQHIFMVRCRDNLGAVSPVKVRTFFRTNNPPAAPKVKWALDVALGDEALEYQVNYPIQDTLFWGDTLTNTYSGIGFLWQGSDPDSRDLNIIPLTFRWLLVNETTGDTMPHPVLSDSNTVTGFASGWSDWASSTLITFSAAFADSAFCLRTLGHYFELDGRYKFLLQVRDDGLTLSDTTATATFFAYKPIYDHQLLVIDWNALGNADPFGKRNYDDIYRFYQQVIPEGIQVAERVRQTLYSQEMPDPILNDVTWFNDNQLGEPNRISYEAIRHYKWVWCINDNPERDPPSDEILKPRIKVMQDYMNVGGQVMISGRRLFNGTFGLTDCGQLGSAMYQHNFLSLYNKMISICAKTRFSPPASPDYLAEFGGVSTTDLFLPQLQVDTAIVHQLNWRNRRYDCLPEIDYFGRASGLSGYDFSSTLYNYWSCTTDTARYHWTSENVDCEVLSATPSQCILLPPQGITRIISVSRIYNASRHVNGELMDIHYNTQVRQWQIWVSTPIPAGEWTTADTLEVDYVFIPTDVSHSQPIADNFTRIQGVLKYDGGTGIFQFQGQVRFRSSVFAFPLSFMKNDYTEPVPYIVGMSSTPVARVIATQFLFFNGPRIVTNESQRL